MKNKTMIITLAAVLMISFALAPSADAIVAPLMVALPVAGIFGFLFKAISKHVAANEQDHKIAEEKGENTALQAAAQPAK